MAKTWGIPGKRQTYLSPGEQIAKMPKVPLNANPLQSWDYKKSKYRRIDLFPKAVSENTQQGGVVGLPSSAPTPAICSVITFSTIGDVDPVFQFTDCNGVTHQFNGPQGFSGDYCGDFSSASVVSGDGSVVDNGECSDPTQYNPILISLGYNASTPLNSCSASTITYYLLPNSLLEIGTTIYTDYSLDSSFYAPDGYYSDGTDVYEVSDGVGQIISIQTCNPELWNTNSIDWNNESGTWNTI